MNVNIGMMKFPTEWENKKWQPNHQPENFYWDDSVGSHHVCWALQGVLSQVAVEIPVSIDAASTFRSIFQFEKCMAEMNTRDDYSLQYMGDEDEARKMGIQTANRNADDDGYLGVRQVIYCQQIRKVWRLTWPKSVVNKAKQSLAYGQLTKEMNAASVVRSTTEQH